MNFEGWVSPDVRWSCFLFSATFPIRNTLPPAAAVTSLRATSPKHSIQLHASCHFDDVCYFLRPFLRDLPAFVPLLNLLMCLRSPGGGSLLKDISTRADFRGFVGAASTRRDARGGSSVPGGVSWPFWDTLVLPFFGHEFDSSRIHQKKRSVASSPFLMMSCHE